MDTDWHGPWTPDQLLQGPLKGLVGRSALYEQLRQGTIRSTRLGHRYLVPDREVRRILGEDDD